MSRGASGYARVPAELYQTPSWVLDCLAEHVPLAGRYVWEPACGEGQLVRAMEAHGAKVRGTDLHAYEGGGEYGIDFLQAVCPGADIISNPPYGKRCLTAEAFIRHALKQISKRGLVAMLLPVDFDSAKSRADIFENCPLFVAKIVLRRRIKWFDLPPDPGKKKQGPTENHAWFIWQALDAFGPGTPRILYAPKTKEPANGEA